MHRSLLGSSRLAAIALAAGVLTIGVSTNAASHPKPFRSTTQIAPPPAITFNFMTVDGNPNSSNNRVTGINQLADIVGVYGSNCTNDPFTSFTSAWPFTKFVVHDYPNSKGTYLTSITENNPPALAGFVCSPDGKPGIWGAILYNDKWYLIPPDPNEGTGQNAVMELLGINDNPTAVGYYLDSNGSAHAFEVSLPSEQVAYFYPPFTLSAEAAGINGKGDVTGVETSIANNVQGWFHVNFSYYTFSYPESLSTTPYGINWQDQIVGSYMDSSGKTQGFISGDPAIKLSFQPIYEPKNLGLTVVSDVNNYDCITGWYRGAQKQLHGFVATSSDWPECTLPSSARSR